MNLNRSSIPTCMNHGNTIFMGAKKGIENCNIGILGIPYDGTTSFKPGTRFGPSAIKEVSHSIETYCPQLEMDLEDLNFVDLGLLEITHGAPEAIIQETKASIDYLLDKKIKPLILGGEHSITTGIIESLINKYPELIIVQLDAHADLRDEWLGSRFNHACTMRRCLELLPSKNILQVGVRSGTKLEFTEMRSTNRLIKYQQGEHPSQLNNILEKHIGKPIYLTFDLDWFDPSLLPGTGTPEPGGFLWEDFEAIVDILKRHHLIGADIVELSPQLDLSGVSSIVAAKVTRTLIMLLSK